MIHIKGDELLMESVNVRLKDLRYAEGKSKLTQQDVADMLHLSQASIADYEKEGYYVPCDVLIKYCKAFNVSADYLLGLTNARITPNFEVHELGLTDSAMEKLKDKKTNSLLLSEIIEHDNFNKMLLDAEIYVEGYVDESVHRYNNYYKTIRANLQKSNNNRYDMEKELTTLEYVEMDQDVLFSGRLSSAMLSVLKDIKFKHKDDVATSDYQDGLSDQDVFLNVFYSSTGLTIRRFVNGLGTLLKIKMTASNTKKLEALINEDALEDVLGQSALIEPDDRKRRRKK